MTRTTSRVLRALECFPTITDRARELTAPAAPITFAAHDVLAAVPPGPYDVVTCVATLHHMPFGEALTCLRRRLAPGGPLIVVGVHRPHAWSDRLRDAVPFRRTSPGPASGTGAARRRAPSP